jgi:purine-nucleoside phosphorylase
MNLLLSAFLPELGDLATAPPEGWACACTGIGALEAAIATSRLIAEHHPARVLFLGTCGAYDDRLRIDTQISAAEALATSASELRGAAFRPEAERVRWPATWSLPFPAQVIAVPPAITRDADEARLLAGVAAAEHLELTGVFAACHAAGVPVAAALGVANFVGPEAHGEWMENHAEVSRNLVKALRSAGILTPIRA